MGQVYLAHLRRPFFGPPFAHPCLDRSPDGRTIRAHLIGATSPKDDTDHYMQAAMDLMQRYQTLLMRYPQCPLIINYPGWIFGQGLEVAMWLVSSLGLTDVLYMSEKGPPEVVEPLGQAAQTARVPLTILPSQPTDCASRSSVQLRTMQIQSYFHQTHPEEIQSPLWLNTPISRMRCMSVDYRTGILGIMVMGPPVPVYLLHEVIEGAIVGVVAIESAKAFLGSYEEEGEEGEVDMPRARSVQQHQQQAIIMARTLTPRENLPYLFRGAGSSTPLDPRVSYSLGLAMVRKIDVGQQRLELVTPIPGKQIAEAMRQGHGFVLVRGSLDNPNWAISEEYYAARAAERRFAGDNNNKFGDAVRRTVQQTGWGWRRRENDDNDSGRCGNCVRRHTREGRVVMSKGYHSRY